MTWLDDYRKRLRAASSLAPVSNPVTGPSAADIAANIISMRTPSAGQSSSGSEAPSTLWELGAQAVTGTGWGGRAIDILSRGTYASANPHYQAAQRGENTLLGAAFKTLINPGSSENHWDNISNPIDDLRAVGRGLAGKDKITYSDVLKAEGVGEGPGRAVAGFGLDVLADPLTFIPATWFAKGYSAVGKGVSAATPKGVKRAVLPSRKTNAETVVKDTEQKYLDDFLNKGSVDVVDNPTGLNFYESLLERRNTTLDPNTNFVPASRDLRNEISIPQQQALPSGTLQNYASYREQPQGRFVAGEQGTVFEPEGGFGKRDFTSFVLADEANNLLGSIPATRQTSDLFYDRLAGMTDEFEEVITGTRTTFERDPEIFVKEKLVNRHLRNTSPDTKLRLPEGVKIPGIRGKQASRRQLGEWISKARNATERAERVKILDDSYSTTAAALVRQKPKAVEKLPIRSMNAGKQGTTPIGQVVREALEESPAPRQHRRRTVIPYARKADQRGGNKVIPLDDYIDQLRTQVSELRNDPLNISIENIVEQRLVGQTPQFERARFAKGSEGLKNWRNEMLTNGFTKAEINYLNRAANLGESQYNNALARVNAKRETRFTLDELEAALKDGRVDAADLQPLFDRYNVKTIRGLKTKLTKIFDRQSDVLQRNQPSTQMEGGYQFGEWLDSEGLRKSFAERARERSIETTPDDPWYNITEAADDMPTAEEFVEAAKRTGDQVIEKNLAVLGEQSATAVRENLKNVVKYEFLQPKLWKHSSNTGTLRTHKTLGDGYGRNIEGYNIRSQYTASRGLVKQLNANHRDWFAITDSQRAERYLEALKVQEDTLRQYNINPILGEGKIGDPLSIHDVFSVLGNDFVARHYINVNRALPITHLMRIVDTVNASYKKARADKAAGEALDSVGQLRDSLLSIAKEPLPPRKDPTTGKIPTRRTKSGKEIPARGRENNFIKQAKRSTGAKSARSKEIDEYIANELIDPIIAAWPEFNRTIERNLANLGLKVGESTKYITDEVVKKFADDLDNNEIASLIARTINPKSDITQAAKEINAANIPGIGIRSQEIIEVSLSDFVNTPGLYAAAKGAQAHAGVPTGASLPKGRAATSALVKEHTKVNTKIGVNTQQQYDEVVDLFRQQTEELLDIGQEIELNLMARLQGGIAPHAGAEQIHEMLRAQRIVSQADAMRYSRGLHQVHQRYSPDQIRSAFHMIQNNQLEGISDEMAPVVKELNRLVKEVFDTGEDALYGSIGRSGITAVELNKQFDLKGMPKQFRFENNEIGSWANWTIDDPLDFLSRAQNSVRTIQTYQTLGFDLGHRFAVTKSQPGYVKITNKNGAKSTLFDYIDSDLYFPRDIADQIIMMDRNLTKFMEPRSRNSFIRTYDTVLHSLKAGFTIYRPGHHVRNRIGDLWMNFMDGVFDPIHYINAYKMLATARGKYPDFEFRQALRGFGEVNTTGRAVVTVKIGGKKRQITAEEAYNLMYRHGGLPDHSIIEDLTFNSPISGMEGIARAAGTGGQGQSFAEQLSRFRPAGGKVNRAAVATSEVGEHYMRAAHFLSAFKQTKPRTHFPNGKKMTEAEILDDMAIRANERVRKFHPDGSDITKFERDVMRRGIFFYSWIRKAVPLVLEMMLTRPGRFMVYPKAMYNMAEGMGIDLQSMGNPFPTDQLFPNFLTESIQGPVLGERNNYWGLKMGTPGVDVVDEFLHSPTVTGETLLNSLVPFARVPIELGTQHRVGGIPIQDYSDYIGQQIPNATYADKAINSLTGRSALSGFTQPRYEAKSNEGYEASQNPSFVNWLLGVGLTDMSKPSYIKSAEFDARDRARERFRRE